jgi:hypothetical protein
MKDLKGLKRILIPPGVQGTLLRGMKKGGVYRCRGTSIYDL